MKYILFFSILVCFWFANSEVPDLEETQTEWNKIFTIKVSKHLCETFREMITDLNDEMNISGETRCLLDQMDIKLKWDSDQIIEGQEIELANYCLRINRSRYFLKEYFERIGAEKNNIDYEKIGVAGAPCFARPSQLKRFPQSLRVSWDEFKPLEY